MSELDMAPLLNEKIEVLSGFAFPSSGFNQLDGLPLIRIRDLGGSTTEVRFRGAYDPAYRVSKGDLLVGMDGDFEVYRWEGGDALLNQRVCKISSASREIDQGFLYWYLKPKIAEIHRRTPQTTVRHLSTKSLYAIAEPTVGFPEQGVIAQILGTLDTAIRETEALIDKLKAVKQGLLHDLLTRGIDANGQLRPPQSEASQLYKESPLGWIPREWEVSTVGDCCDIHNNLRLPIASEIREKMQGEYPYYGPTGLLDHINEYRVEGTYTLIGEDGDHFLKFESKPMTQLVSGKFNVNNHAHLLKGRNCLTEWIDVWFRHRDITLYLTRQGAGRFKLNKAGLLNLLIARPSQDEQQAICTTVAQQEARITAEVECRAKLLCHKAGLMDDLLTGRVRVTPLLESVQQPAAHPGA